MVTFFYFAAPFPALSRGTNFFPWQKSAILLKLKTETENFIYTRGSGAY